MAGLAEIMSRVQGAAPQGAPGMGMGPEAGPPGLGMEPPIPRELMIQMIMLILETLQSEGQAGGGPGVGPGGPPPMPPQGGGGLPF